MGILIWVINNVSILSFELSGLDILFSSVIMRILIIICIITIGTIVLDIVPLREFVFYFTRKLDKKKVAINIGSGQIIEIDKTKVKIIYRTNLIIAFIEIFSAFFIFFIVYLFGMNYVSIERIKLGNMVINQILAEYFLIAILVFFACSLLVSSIVMLYINKEVLIFGM